MPTECNIQSSKAGSPSGEYHALRHDDLCKREDAKCTTKPGNRLGMPWKYVLDEAGKLRPFKCPKCGEEIRYLPEKSRERSRMEALIGCGVSTAVNCGTCGWNPSMLTSATQEVWDSLRTDPEMIPAKRYMERLEFNDNKNRINGKYKRDKKAISRACY